MGCINSKGNSVEPEGDQQRISDDDTPIHSVAQESASWTAGLSGRQQHVMGVLPRWPVDQNNITCDANHPEKNVKPSHFFDSYHYLSEPDEWQAAALSEIFSEHSVSDVETVRRMPIPFMAYDSDDSVDTSQTKEGVKVVITSPFDPTVRCLVDNPDESKAGVLAFPRGNDSLKPDDTIWAEKRKYMESYSSVKSLDQHALKAADNLRFSPPKKIVNLLTSVAKNDFQKFRVLFRWVAHAITYEFSYLSKGPLIDINPISILEAGSGDSSDISVLLQYLCSVAGLTCETIEGYNKNIMPGKPPLKHAWNRVRLDGRWFLADCTAALHTSASSCVPVKFREYEFLSEPQYFNSRRIPRPMDRYGELLPYTSYQQFNRMPTFGPMASVCDLKCTSHNVGVIRANENNSVGIDLTSSLPLMTWASLTSSVSYQDRQEHVVMWWEGNVLHSVIELPENGVWEFKIFGQLVCDRGKDRDANALIPPTIIDTGHCHLATFTIIASEGRENPPRLAPDTGMCGIALTCTDIHALSHKSPFVEAERGKAFIAILMPDYSVRMVYRLLNIDMHHTFITNRVYMERVGKAVLIHVFCPNRGRYALRLLINKTGKDYNRQGEYLISHTGEGEDEKSIRFSQTLGYHVWGPNEHFIEHEIKLISGHTSSTIVAIEGEVVLQMTYPTKNGLFFSCSLQEIKKEDRLQAGRVLVDSRVTKSSLSITTFHVRMKETGFFVLQVYVRVKETTRNKRVGGWLIVVNKKSNKLEFPVEALVCGPNEIFYKMGMRTGSTKLETTDGQARIDISYEAEFERTFRFDVVSSSHNRYEECVNVTTSAKRVGSLYIASFHLSLPVPNIYAIRIMTVGDVVEWSAIGTWIVIYDMPRSSSTRIIGPAGLESPCS